VRLQHTLRRSDQQGNRKIRDSRHANLHDDPGGEGSRLDARHALRRHHQPDRQSRAFTGKRKSVQARADSPRAAKIARGSLEHPSPRRRHEGHEGFPGVRLAHHKSPIVSRKACPERSRRDAKTAKNKRVNSKQIQMIETPKFKTDRNLDFGFENSLILSLLDWRFVSDLVLGISNFKR
jgi:hypothetical protein